MACLDTKWHMQPERRTTRTTKCRLERKQKVADKVHSLLRASKGKLINAEPPGKQKSPPAKEEEPTDSQVSSFTIEATDVGHHCHM